MPTTVERLNAVYDADFRGYQNNSRRFRQGVDNDTRHVGQQFQAMAQKVQTAIRLIGVGLTANLVTNYANAWSELGNTLRRVIDDENAIAEAQQRLYEVAQRSNSEIAAVTQTYANLIVATDGLGLSQAKLLRLTETIAKAAPGATAAIRQLGQALASGSLRGDELVSVLEGAPAIARAIAASMGVTVGQLRVLASEGKVTTDVVLNALDGYAAQSDAIAERMQSNIPRALTKLNNAFTRYIGSADQSLGITTALASGIDMLAENLDTLGDALLVIAAILVGRFGAAMIQADRTGRLLSGGMAALTSRAAASAVAVRGLQAALAFFGGPIGLAITAIAGAMFYLSNQTKSTSEKFEDLQTKITEAGEAASRLEAVNRDLEQSKDDLKKASDRYKQAVEKEGETAQNAAALEISAIRARIEERQEEAKTIAAVLKVKQQELQIAASVAREALLKPILREIAPRGVKPGRGGARVPLVDQVSEEAALVALEKKAEQVRARIFTGENTEADNLFIQEFDALLRLQGEAKKTGKVVEDVLNFDPEKSKFSPAAGTGGSTDTPGDSGGADAEEKKAISNLTKIRRLKEDIAVIQREIMGIDVDLANTAERRIDTEEKRLAIDRAREDALTKGKTEEEADEIAEVVRLQQRREASFELLNEYGRQQVEQARAERAASEESARAEEEANLKRDAASERRLDAARNEARLREDLASIEEALGGFEGERAKTARAALETEQAKLQIARAYEDALRESDGDETYAKSAKAAEELNIQIRKANTLLTESEKLATDKAKADEDAAKKADRATQKREDAQKRQQRLQEDLKAVQEQLGDFETQRAQTVKDALRVEQDRLAVARAREDALKRSGGDVAYAEAVSEGTRLTLELGNANRLLSEKEALTTASAKKAADAREKLNESMAGLRQNLADQIRLQAAITQGKDAYEAETRAIEARDKARAIADAAREGGVEVDEAAIREQIIKLGEETSETERLTERLKDQLRIRERLAEIASGEGSRDDRLNVINDAYEQAGEATTLEEITAIIDERDRLILSLEREFEIQQAIRELGENATEDQIQRMRDLKGAEIDYRNSVEMTNEKIDERRDKIEEGEKAQQQANEQLAQGFAGLLDDLDNVEDGLKKLGLQILKIIATGFFEKLLGVPEAGQSGGALGGLGAILGGALGDIFREEGGPVRAGQPYIVGERRPEVFVPNTSGTILPRVPSGSGRAVMVNQHINVTGLGIDDVERKLAPRFQEMRQQTIADVQSKFASDAEYLS